MCLGCYPGAKVQNVFQLRAIIVLKITQSVRCVNLQSLADLISLMVHAATLAYHSCSFSLACSRVSFLFLKDYLQKSEES